MVRKICGDQISTEKVLALMIISVLSQHAREFIEVLLEKGLNPNALRPPPNRVPISPENTQQPRQSTYSLNNSLTAKARQPIPSHHSTLVFHHDPFTMRFPVMYSQ